tara:strand:+ start:310 stop:858 length:549 start_codon:yes stop_codon:yes gene_type:complete
MLKKILIIVFIMFNFLNKAHANYDKLAYDFKFNDINGNELNFEDYRNKVLVVVNVASRCGFTNQYKDLQLLWKEYQEKELVVIGVPTNNFKQEPGTNEQIKDFCETTFGITFPITEKVNVLGDNAHPFYKWAKDNYGRSAIPKWNFHKIIINKEGKIANTFSSITKPSSKKFMNFIEQEIKN